MAAKFRVFIESNPLAGEAVGQQVDGTVWQVGGVREDGLRRDLALLPVRGGDVARALEVLLGVEVSVSGAGSTNDPWLAEVEGTGAISVDQLGVQVLGLTSSGAAALVNVTELTAAGPAANAVQFITLDFLEAEFERLRQGKSFLRHTRFLQMFLAKLLRGYAAPHGSRRPP